MSSDAKRELERNIFEGFVAVCPEVAGGLASWEQPKNDPPDILGKLKSGKPCGFELKAWLNEGQIAAARARDKLEEGFRAIFKDVENGTNSVGMVWLSPRRQAPKGDVGTALRDQLVALISECDARWHNGSWDPAQGVVLVRSAGDLTKYPVLAEHMNSVHLHSVERIRIKRDWIRLPGRGGAYGERDMLEPLLAVIEEANQNYLTLKRDMALDQFSLLVHYDARAYQYNSPIQGPEFNLDTFAEEATFHFAGISAFGQESAFDAVYLYDAVHRRGLRLWP